jgi:hypothetical protein
MQVICVRVFLHPILGSANSYRPISTTDNLFFPHCYATPQLLGQLRQPRSPAVPQQHQ